jgi:hypothetical protein
MRRDVSSIDKGGDGIAAWKRGIAENKGWSGDK